jgi:hypothetical protein
MKQKLALPPRFESWRYRYPFEWRVLLLGQTRSGKTYAARRLADQHYGKVPIYCLQTKPRDRVLDALRVPRVRDTVSLDRRKGQPMVILRPPVEWADDPEFLTDFCKWALHKASKHGRCIIWINEVASITGESFRPTRAYSQLVKYGQGMGVGMIQETQEPAFVPRIVFSESSLIARFFINNEVSLKAITQKAPSVLRPPIRAEDKHGFWLWDSRRRDQGYYFREIA